MFLPSLQQAANNKGLEQTRYSLKLMQIMYKIYIYFKENTTHLNYRHKMIDAVNDKIYSRCENSLCGNKGEF